MAGGDLDFLDLERGTGVPLSGDHTDEYGFYSVCVQPGRYRVTFAPPPGTRLLGKELPEVDLRANGGRELDVVLDAGWIVAGVVRTADGLPRGGVDVDVDRLSGGRMYTPYDKSEPNTGSYAVVLPDGTYRFRFTPPRGERWQGLQLGSVSIAGDLTLDATLEPGALLAGSVVDDGGRPLSNVDVDLRRRADGARIFVVNGSTGADGRYEATVPIGSFEVRFDPPSGSRTVASRLDSLEIAGDTRLDLVLANGLLVCAVVLDSTGAPLEDVDLTAVQESTGRKLYLPNDKTDKDGQAVLAVPPDRYSFRFDPPSGSNLERLELGEVTLNRDTTLAVRFPGFGWARVTGRVVDPAGAGVADATVLVLATPGSESTRPPQSRTDATGGFELRMPRGPVEMCVAPPRGARLVARRLPMTVVVDVALGNILLETGSLLTVRVTDSGEMPVDGAVLELVTSTAGAGVYTPHGRTDDHGTAIVALQPGTYDATVTPPDGVGLSHAVRTGIETLSDTRVEFVLRPLEGATPLVSFQWLAPNPFERAVDIGVRVGAPTNVSIDVYDATGRRVRALERADRPASNFSCAWDGNRWDGTPAPSGVYFVILRASGTSDARKILLLR